MRVLKTPESSSPTISNAQKQIAGSSCGFHPLDWVLDVGVVLKHISEQKGERVSDSGLFPEALIRVGNSDLKIT